jgi:hypothetical protein
MSKAKTNKLTVADRYQALLKGLASDLPSVTTFDVDGETLAKASLVALLQASIDAMSATAAAKAAYQLAIGKERTAKAAAGPAYAAMERYLRARFGPSAKQLADFGIAPAKPHHTTAATKAEAVVKGQATRKANHPAKKPKVAPPSPAPAGPPPAPAKA